ncbi:FkbM family methyltransferase [Rhodopirellula bahusiensis]|uniref:FkbM family methyltransferase n=2 Tax=Pseudomonadati TaxID=3379134 RepID=UPI003266BEC2
MAGHRIAIRTRTSDLNVAYHALIKEEYKGIDCHDPAVVLDVGANIGTSSIYFAQLFPNAKIFAIEMEASNYELLKRNTSHLDNVTCVQAAIASETGKRSIVDRGTGPWGYTIASQKGESRGDAIEAITLDEFMTRHSISQIDLLKMDVEGAEKEIFAAGGDWLTKTDVIACELHDRICLGCDRAFYVATQNFSRLEKHREKVVVYR